MVDNAKGVQVNQDGSERVANELRGERAWLEEKRRWRPTEVHPTH